MGLAEREYMRSQGPNDPYRPTEPKSPTTRTRSDRYAAVIVAVAIFGLVILPHLTIDGRHWHLIAF